MSIRIMTLGFNLPSEIEIAINLLYEKNKSTSFDHTIIDLGFPLKYGADIPDDIEATKEENSLELMSIAKKYGSAYVKIKNIGVSQNWSFASKLLCVGKDDVIIGCEPDETPLTDDWVSAMSDVLSEKNVAMCSLLMKDQEVWLKDRPDVYKEKIIAGHRCIEVNGAIAMALIGFSGAFLEKASEVPVPSGSSIYGSIEAASCSKISALGYSWCFLADYYVKHNENVPLYRKYKTDITSGNYSGVKQIHFEQWLQLKKK